MMDPAGFTKEFAASLNNLCPLTVTEARDGEPFMPGHVYIAPGNYHIYVEHRPLGNLVRLSQEPQRNANPGIICPPAVTNSNGPRPFD